MRLIKLSINKVIYNFDGIIIGYVYHDYRIYTPEIGQVLIYNNEQYITIERIFDNKEKILNINLKKNK